jgi:hypothetical protein
MSREGVVRPVEGMYERRITPMLRVRPLLRRRPRSGPVSTRGPASTARLRCLLAKRLPESRGSSDTHPCCGTQRAGKQHQTSARSLPLIDSSSSMTARSYPCCRPGAVLYARAGSTAAAKKIAPDRRSPFHRPQVRRGTLVRMCWPMRLRGSRRRLTAPPGGRSRPRLPAASTRTARGPVIRQSAMAASWSASRPRAPASIGQRPPHSAVAEVWRTLKLTWHIELYCLRYGAGVARPVRRSSHSRFQRLARRRACVRARAPIAIRTVYPRFPSASARNARQ